MWWESQSIEAEAGRRLPGLGHGGTIRTFDAPEAMGIEFLEVESKSALNRVPGESLPFNWTVSPYRGCTHACSYCLDGGTPILMADGSTERLADLRAGDDIFGTVEIGPARWYVRTEVRDVWSTRKRAFRIELADGTELLASSDHRFLAQDGWSFVAGSHQATRERRTLRGGTRLAGLTEQDSELLGSSAPMDAAVRRGDLRTRLGHQLLTCPVKLPPGRVVASVEPVGEMELFDITTGTGDFIADGVVSHNCFARPTHRYLDLNAREDFERKVVVKVDLPERLRAELARPSWLGETIALGTNTDPYQWVEGRYGLTRAVWEVMIEAQNPGSVLTKSPLLTRDIDLMKELNVVAGFQASLSIPTLDEEAWRATEPRTPHPRKRIEAVAALAEAGVPVGVLVAPLMPGINDSPEQVEEIVRLCAEAGADNVGGLGLHLKGEVKEIFFDWLRAHRPDLVGDYERLYRRGAFLPQPERERIGRMISRAREKAGVGDTGWREGVRRNRERTRIERAERRGERAGSPVDGPDPTSLQRQSRLF